jgi:hypothetical protein
MNKTQIARIKRMEGYLDAAEEALSELSKAMDRYESICKKYYKLEDYYGGSLWMRDFEDDEAGILPDDLKRGVLSEDAVYDLIMEHDELMRRMQRAVLMSLGDR